MFVVLKNALKNDRSAVKVELVWQIDQLGQKKLKIGC